MSELINRPEYLKQLIENKDVDLIKILTDIRGCGKSSLLDLFHKYLTENNVPDSNIIHMNLESLRYRDLTDYLKFYDYVSSLIPSQGKTYLIFDELQVIDHWEKAIESFRLDFDVDIICYRLKCLSSLNRIFYTALRQICGDTCTPSFIQGISHLL